MSLSWTWIWLIVIVAGVIIDYLSSDFLFVSFSLGAFCAILINLIGVSIFFQVLIFGVISILFLIFVYPKVKRKIKNEKLGTKTMEQEYIGKTFILDKDVSNTALIKYEGIYWTFKANKEKLTKGEKVKIIAINGNKIVIDKF